MVPSVSSYGAMHCTGNVPARKIMMVTMRNSTSQEQAKKQPLRTLLRRIFKGFIHNNDSNIMPNPTTKTVEDDVPVLTFINDTCEESDFITVVPLARRRRITPGPCIFCTAMLDCSFDSCKLQRQGAHRREASRALRVMHRHPSQGLYPSELAKVEEEPTSPAMEKKLMKQSAKKGSLLNGRDVTKKLPYRNKTPIYSSLMAQIATKKEKSDLPIVSPLFTVDTSVVSTKEMDKLVTTMTTTNTPPPPYTDPLPTLGIRERRSSAWTTFLAGDGPKGQPNDIDAICSIAPPGPISNSRIEKRSISNKQIGRSRPWIGAGRQSIVMATPTTSDKLFVQRSISALGFSSISITNTAQPIKSLPVVRAVSAHPFYYSLSSSLSPSPINSV